jgi:hypothetical protein
MRKMLGASAFAAVLAISGVSLASTPSFEDLDKNKDGMLSKSETSSVEELDFAKADTNKDGMLNRSEYEAAIS